MHRFVRLRNSFKSAAALAIAAACAATSVNAMPTLRGSPAHRASAGPGGVFAFISDENNQAVYILNKRGSIVATLTGITSPQGLAVDRSHNLYVADAATSRILVYARPYNKTPKVLSDSGFVPEGVAVDGKGNVAVANPTSTDDGPGSVAFYTNGATSPTSIIPASSHFAGDFFCAFDANGNLYLDAQAGSGPFEAGEVIGGVSGTEVTPLTTNNLIRLPGGIQVTTDSKIAILDQSDGTSTATIYSYQPPVGGSFGDPVATTALSGSTDPVSFAFTLPNDGFLFAAGTFGSLPILKRRTPNGTSAGKAQVFQYPSGGLPVDSAMLPRNAILVGVAIDPAATP